MFSVRPKTQQDRNIEKTRRRLKQPALGRRRDPRSQSPFRHRSSQNTKTRHYPPLNPIPENVADPPKLFGPPKAPKAPSPWKTYKQGQPLPAPTAPLPIPIELHPEPTQHIPFFIQDITDSFHLDGSPEIINQTIRQFILPIQRRCTKMNVPFLTYHWRLFCTLLNMFPNPYGNKPNLHLPLPPFKDKTYADIFITLLNTLNGQLYDQEELPPNSKIPTPNQSLRKYNSKQEIQKDKEFIQKYFFGTEKWVDQIHIIGKGSYGIVYSAQVNGQTRAVKSLHIKRLNYYNVTEIIIGQYLQSVHCSRGTCQGVSLGIRRCQCFPTRVFQEVPWCNGRDLFDLYGLMKGDASFSSIALKANLTPTQFIASILKAVHLLHQNNIVHQDLKPENLMLCLGPFGSELKMIDFGLAGFANYPLKNARGTHTYLPNGYASGQNGPGSFAVDLYAVAVFIFAMLSDYWLAAFSSVSSSGQPLQYKPEKVDFFEDCTEPFLQAILDKKTSVDVYFEDELYSDDKPRRFPVKPYARDFIEHHFKLVQLALLILKNGANGTPIVTSTSDLVRAFHSSSYISSVRLRRQEAVPYHAAVH